MKMEKRKLLDHEVNILPNIHTHVPITKEGKNISKVFLSVCVPPSGKRMHREASELQVLSAGSPFQQPERAHRDLWKSDRTLPGL